MKGEDFTGVIEPDSFFWGDQTMEMYGNFDLFPLGIVVIKIN